MLPHVPAIFQPSVSSDKDDVGAGTGGSGDRGTEAEQESEPVLTMKTLQWSYFTPPVSLRQHGPRLHRGHPLCCSSSHSCKGNTDPGRTHQPSFCSHISYRDRTTTSPMLIKTCLIPCFSIWSALSPADPSWWWKTHTHTHTMAVAKKHTHTILPLRCLPPHVSFWRPQDHLNKCNDRKPLHSLFQRGQASYQCSHDSRHHVTMVTTQSQPDL